MLHGRDYKYNYKTLDQVPLLPNQIEVPDCVGPQVTILRWALPCGLCTPDTSQWYQATCIFLINYFVLFTDFGGTKPVYKTML